MADGSDLHPLVAGFADAAAVYDRGRPGYPPPVVERIVAELGVEDGARVLDLGAGTGMLSRPLLEAGLDVVAVEPLPGMRAALAAAIGADRAVEGRAEAIPLGDASLDGAVSGDAFHWFDGERAAVELHRVLRPGAGLVVVWLNGVEEHSAFEHELTALLEPLWERGRHPSIKLGRRAEGIAEHGGFAPIRRVEVPVEDEIDRDGFLAWFQSFSVVGALDDDERAPLLERVGESFDRHVPGDILTRRWNADLWVTRRL
jgi:SAM-dependent methyltransferase